MTTHLPVIEIRIVECRGRGGCYGHIHNAPVRYCTLRVCSCDLYFLALWAVSDKMQKNHGKLKGDLEVCKLSAFILSFSAFKFFSWFFFFYFCKCLAASSQRYFRVSVPSLRAGGGGHIPGAFTDRIPMLEGLLSHGLSISSMVFLGR